MFNPRFPHTMRVLRAEEDETGNPVLDDNGNPSYGPVVLDRVVESDGGPVSGPDGRFLTEQAETIEFGYRRASLNARDTGDVSVLTQMIALPLFTTPLRRGDIIEITDSERTYRGTVIKKQSFNLGSNVWFEEVRN